LAQAVFAWSVDAESRASAPPTAVPMFRLAASQVARRAGAVRGNSTIAGTLYYRCSYHDSKKVALICPHEKVQWTYGEFWEHVQRVAAGLKGLGYQQNSVVATDMKNTVPNLLLQMAAAHNGMVVLTVKNAAELDKLSEQIPVQGAVLASSGSFLSKATFPTTSLDAAALAKLSGKATEGATNRDAPLAYYSSAQETTNREIYLYGVGTAGTLEINDGDKVCVAASLNHPFGIGGAISAIIRNAAIYLPDMENPDLQDSTVVITDTHKLPSLRDAAAKGSKVRGGIVKVGSGFDLLTDKEALAGAELWTMGSAPNVFRPLFDACVDTYYSYK